jgi:hypothetical protein
MAGEDYDMELEEGKKLKIAAEMNEFLYTEPILSIDDYTSNYKFSFNLGKGLDSKYYADGNESMAFEMLSNKFELLHALSLALIELVK